MIKWVSSHRQKTAPSESQLNHQPFLWTLNHEISSKHSNQSSWMLTLHVNTQIPKGLSLLMSCFCCQCACCWSEKTDLWIDSCMSLQIRVHHKLELRMYSCSCSPCLLLLLSQTLFFGTLAFHTKSSLGLQKLHKKGRIFLSFYFFLSQT